LLATAFSKPARRAYTHALVLASALKSRLIMLHVLKAPPDFESWSPRARRSLGTFKTKALLEFGRMALVAKGECVTTKTTLSVGVPEDEILKVAESTRAELIVMGTHGRTGLEKLRLGSVAEAVLRGTTTPILLLRAAGAPVAAPDGNARRVEASHA